MNKIRCLVADDEQLAVGIIESHLSKLPDFIVTGICNNGTQVYQFLKKHPVDLLFLDIQMPELTGLELLRTLKDSPPAILTTASREFALEGFEFNVIDYLLKPISFERFLKAVEKAQARITGFDSIRTIKHEPGFCYIKTNQRYEKLSFDDILFIESMLNYIHVITKSGKFTVYSSMKNAEAILPKDGFIRIHKSYIVSITKINSIEPKQIGISDYKLPISRGNRSGIIESARKLGLILEISPKVGKSERKKDPGQ